MRDNNINTRINSVSDITYFIEANKKIALTMIPLKRKYKSDNLAEYITIQDARNKVYTAFHTHTIVN